MISEETLFILGAGASKPYRYLTGKELRKYICKGLPTDLSAIISKDTGLDNTHKQQLNT